MHVSQHKQACRSQLILGFACLCLVFPRRPRQSPLSACCHASVSGLDDSLNVVSAFLCSYACGAVQCACRGQRTTNVVASLPLPRQDADLLMLLSLCMHLLLQLYHSHLLASTLCMQKPVSAQSAWQPGTGISPDRMQSSLCCCFRACIFLQDPMCSLFKASSPCLPRMVRVFAAKRLHTCVSFAGFQGIGCSQAMHNIEPVHLEACMCLPLEPDRLL